jgi:hypothetical protein
MTRILDQSDQVRIVRVLSACLATIDELARLLRDNAGPDNEQMCVASIIAANMDIAKSWSIQLQCHIEAKA